jgi:CRP-like cAMP-binding protein
MKDGRSAEMATTGREGIVMVSAVLGGRRALYRNIVQVPGSALRIDIRQFRKAQSEIAGLQDALLRYARAFLAQVLQSVACNGVHSVEERCARWLLMTCDRCGHDSFPLTQEFLGQMLGVSRVAVGEVARTFQRAGLIRYSRGNVAILDKLGLEETSCECYRTVLWHYQQRAP